MAIGSRHEREDRTPQQQKPLGRWLEECRSAQPRSRFDHDRAAADNGPLPLNTMEHMTAHRCALLIALLAWVTSACDSGSDGPERLLEGWERDGREVPQSEFQVYAGPGHCEWEDALILDMRWPPDRGDNGVTGLSFVRDPEGVMADYTDEPFVPDADLPDDAVATGYRNDAGPELWLANDLTTAYLVDGDTVEAWAALDNWICA